jgi:hypothetical protein
MNKQFGKYNTYDNLHERGGIDVSGYVFTDSKQIVSVHAFLGIRRKKKDK